ncbi:MAG: proton-conducting transporter membrane subunit [Candidatus Krumholzibacteriia bacterium]
MIGTFLARHAAVLRVLGSHAHSMYFIIGIWGGQRRDVYAAVKFFIFTMAGSVFMLVAILYCYFKAGTMNLHDWLALDLGYARAALAVHGLRRMAFAIKVPLWPLHAWCPMRVEAPTAGSVVLAGVLLKMGTYGLRFAIPLFPEAAVLRRRPCWAFAVVLTSCRRPSWRWVQTDVKEADAVWLGQPSSSVRECSASSASQGKGAAGGVFQMLAHGLSTGALFSSWASSTSGGTRGTWRGIRRPRARHARLRHLHDHHAGWRGPARPVRFHR